MSLISNLNRLKISYEFLPKVEKDKIRCPLCGRCFEDGRKFSYHLTREHKDELTKPALKWLKRTARSFDYFLREEK